MSTSPSRCNPMAASEKSGAAPRDSESGGPRAARSEAWTRARALPRGRVAARHDRCNGVEGVSWKPIAAANLSVRRTAGSWDPVVNRTPPTTTERLSTCLSAPVPKLPSDAAPQTHADPRAASRALFATAIGQEKSPNRAANLPAPEEFAPLEWLGKGASPAPGLGPLSARPASLGVRAGLEPRAGRGRRPRLTGGLFF